MAVLPPPATRSADSPDADVLIKEARRRAGRRRLGYVGAAVICAVAVASVAWDFDSGNPPHRRAQDDPGQRPPAEAQPASTGGWRPAAGSLGENDITTLVVDRRHPNILFAAGEGAVFKSVDGGRSWQPLDLEPVVSRVDTLTMSPADPDIVYAGTGSGVYMTVDGGTTWKTSNIGLTFNDDAEHRRLEGYIYRLQVDPHRPDTIYANAGCCSGVAWKSLSAGAIWSPVTVPIKRTFALWLTVDPSRADSVYALAFLRSGNWLLHSRNGGRSWRPLAYPLSGGRAWTLSVDPTNPRTLYLGTCLNPSDSRPTGGLLRSTDGGSTWSSVAPPDMQCLGEPITFDPVRPGRLYLNAWPRVYISSDDARSWRKLDPGRDAGLLAANGDTLYVSTDAGLVRSRNSGRTWHVLPSQPVTAPVTSLAVDPSQPGTAYAGVDHQGVFKRVNGVWRPMNSGLTNKGVHAVAVDPGGSGRVYAATDRGLFLSRDRAASWSRVLGSASAVAVDPRQPSTVYAIATRDDTDGMGDPPRNLFVSTDGGTHWQRLLAVVTASDDDAAIAVHPRHHRVYASTGRGVVRIVDGGKRWDFAGLSHRVVHTLLFDRRGNTLYAGTDVGLYASRDEARSWHRVGGALSSADVQSLAVDPSARRTIYAGTDGAVFRSTTGGRSWQSLGEDLPLRMYDALGVDPAAGLLFAGAYGGGIHEYTLTTSR